MSNLRLRRVLLAGVLAAATSVAAVAAEPEQPPSKVEAAHAALVKASHRVASLVDQAVLFIGVPYRWAGTDERGFDCAGFVKKTFAAIGIKLPRTAADQYMSEGVAVTRDQLLPGDLVFFRNTYKKGISHVGVYVGGGKFIHASTSQKRVSIDPLDKPYYLSRFAGGRRMVTEANSANVPEPTVVACDAPPSR